MTYFEDLSPYRYLGRENEVVNIGWLNRKHPFPTGATSEEFRLKLNQLCKNPINRCFGWHECEFCKGPERAEGNGEIRVSGALALYAAPALIQHYVETHAYLPPEEFIAAVLRNDHQSDQ